MTIDKKEVSGTVAYMLGLRKDLLKRDYGLDEPELIEKLENNKQVTIIRYLCKFRNALFQNFKNIDYQLKYCLVNIDRMPDYIDTDNVRTLGKWGIELLQYNSSAQQYAELVNSLINEHISDCSNIFEDWIRFDYISELFIIPKFNKKGVIKKEFGKYNYNKNYYPYQLYMYWEPREVGNLLINDTKFINWLYSSHKAIFTDTSKTRDMSKENKEDVYEFISNAEKVAIVVDCENSNAFKLYGMLRNLDSERLSMIDKIVLYDDSHTTEVWQWIEKFTSIPIEYIEVERVTEMKSLVDLKMTVGVCKDYYANNIDSFILFSSDSDYWGLISSLPDANFMVMYERDRIGQAMKREINEHEVPNCCIDDIYTGNTEDLKKVVLFDKLEELLPNIVGMDSKDLVKRIFLETQITTNKAEIETFHEKYIKTLQLKIGEDGKFYINIAK